MSELHPVPLEAVGHKRTLILERDAIEVEAEIYNLEYLWQRAQIRLCTKELRSTVKPPDFDEKEVRRICHGHSVTATHARKLLAESRVALRKLRKRIGEITDDIEYVPRGFIPDKEVHRTQIELKGLY